MIKALLSEEGYINNISTKNKLLAEFLAINILTGMCCGIVSIVLPLYVISIGATTGEVGIIKGISGIGALIMVLPSGMLVDHFGAKKLYLFGSMLTAITTFMLAITNLAQVIIIAMALQGFSNSLRFTSLNAAFFSNLKEIGVEKSGWYRGAMSIGLTFLGPLIGGYLVYKFSYSNVFCITAILTIIPIIPMIPYILSEIKTVNKKEIKFNFLSELKEFIGLFSDNTLKQTVIIEGVSTACFSSFLTFIIVYIVEVLKIGAQFASFFMIAEGVAYVLIVFLCGGFLLKYSRKQLYVTSFIGIIAGLVLTATFKIVMMLFLGVIFLGAGIGLLNLITYSNLGSLKAKKGKVSSALSACTSIGSTVGPMLGGILGDLFGYSGIFLGYIPILLILMLYLIASKNKKENIIKEY